MRRTAEILFFRIFRRHASTNMKKVIVCFALSISLFGFIRFHTHIRQDVADIEMRKRSAGGCAPGYTENLQADGDGKYITVLPGWGHYYYSISTKNDSTQFYFNQGLSMYYSYHWQEANASFKEAARFDTGSAISYWGQALALGPGYNFSL